MKNCKNLSTSEVQMIMNGATIFVEPMKQNQYSYFGIPFGEEYTDLEAGQYPSTIINKWGDEDFGPDIWGAISGKGEHCWKSPYQPGQTIYGREVWGVFAGITENDPTIYRADGCWEAQGVEGPVHVENNRWNSPATMPREAARIFLRIDGVQVKSCQDVTEEEARLMMVPTLVAVIDNKRIDGFSFINSLTGMPFKPFELYYKTRFGLESWERNDWIWVYSFTKAEKPTT